MRIIVTRPAAQAVGWVRSLNERGLEAVALPLIGIGAARDPAVVAAAWSTLAQRALVVFVSPNAVEQFFALAPAENAWSPATLAGSPGPGTTAELRARGVPAQNIVEPAADAAQFDSETLWAALAPLDWRGRRVLIVRGEGGREWLGETLQAAGATVENLSAYRRVAPVLGAAEDTLLDAALAAPEQHLWLFSSSAAIDHLDALRSDVKRTTWSRVRCLATHPRIAQRARNLGIGTVLEAPPARDAVVACIQSIRS